jgi:hypothetical protein
MFAPTQAQIDSLQLIPATLPYSCDFNNSSENARWILSHFTWTSSDTVNHFTIGASTSYVQNGMDKSLYVSNDTTGLAAYGANAESSYLFAERIFDFGAMPQDFDLELDWKASGNQSGSSILGGLKVFLRDTAYLMPQESQTYADDFLAVAVNDTAWSHIHVPLHDVSGIKTLQFYSWGYINANTRLVPAAIDNISIMPTSCEAPQFTVTTIGTNAAFSWQGAETDTFLIIYRLANESVQDLVYETVVGNFDTISGLIPNAEYIAWMAKICDGDTSAMYLGTHFTTGCGIYVAPFEEHFGTSQHCWTLDLSFTELSNYIFTSNYVSPTLSTNYGYKDTARAISPAIDVSNLSNPYLKFSRIQNVNNGNHKDLALYYRDNEEDEWHYLGTYITQTTSWDWKTDSLAIPSYSATLQLGFFSIMHGNSQNCRISLDDIYVYDGPECEVVSDVAFVEQSGDTAFIHWVCNNPAGCLVRYKTSADADWTYTVDLGGNAIIESLTPSTHYVVEVASYCDTLIWIPCEFISEAGPVNLPYFTDFSSTADQGWMFDNGTCLNHWKMGAPGAYPQMPHAMFVTYDNTTAGYGWDNFYTIVTASKSFNMSDISTVNIEFDVLCGGNTQSYTPKDYLKVFFAPASVDYPSSESDLTYANASASTYAVDFHDYLSQTGDTNQRYKLNLTQGNVLHISVEMPNPTPNGESKLVFVWHNDYSTGNDVQPAAIITNVHVWQPDCDVVSQLNVYDVIGQSALVSWVPPTNSQSVEFQYKLQSMDWADPSVTTIILDSNYLILHNLLNDTAYDVRVRVDCGDSLGVGGWRYVTFNTSCGIVVTDSTPYIEDFDYVGPPPECWNVTVNPLHSWGKVMYNQTLSHQNHGNHDWGEECPALAPTMDISAVTNPYLKFKHGSGGVRVACRTNALHPWQDLATFYGNATDSLPLPSFSILQIAFFPVNNGSVSLDEVTVYNGPSCLPLTSVTVDDVTANSAAISWVGNSENGYLIRCRDISDTVWTYFAATDTTYIINGLQDSHTYIVEVSGNCDEPNWMAAQLSTSLSVATLPYFTDFSPASDHGWKLNNGDCTNFWTMGELDAANQIYGLFVTKNGSTPGYDITSKTVVTAEKLFELGQVDSIVVEFDIRIGGESSFDFLRLFVAPAFMEYPATSTFDNNNPDYAQYNYATYAYDFTPFFNLSTAPSYLASHTFSSSTGSGFVHIAAKMINPVKNYTNLSQAKVVFLWENDNSLGNQPGPIITNVSVRNNSCTPVSQLTVSNVQSNTADLLWTPGEGGETDWIIEYREPSSVNWTQVTASGTPEYTLTGLTPSRDYEVRVKADCGNNNHSTSVNTAFSTPHCDVFCPYTFILHGGWGYNWNANARIAVIQDGDVTSSLAAISQHVYGESVHDTMFVDICHNADVTVLWDFNSNCNDCGLTVINPEGVTIYTVSSMPTPHAELTTFTGYCSSAVPTVVTDSVDNITQTEAVLHGHIADYGQLPIVNRGFEWKSLFESDYTVVNVSGDSTMSYALTGLQSATAYIYRAFVMTESDTAYGEDVVFNTLEDELQPCPAPTDLHVTDSSDNTLAIAWTENGDAEEWNIQYRSTATGAMSSGISNTTSYLITDLEPNTEYQIQVQAICGTQNSDWSSVVTAQTTTGLPDYDQAFIIYPNPAKNVVIIQYVVNNEYFSGGIQICDVYGKTIVETFHETSLPETHIDVSGLSAGMYFVRVMTEEGTVTKAFVKQ